MGSSSCCECAGNCAAWSLTSASQYLWSKAACGALQGLLSTRTGKRCERLQRPPLQPFLGLLKSKHTARPVGKPSSLRGSASDAPFHVVWQGAARGATEGSKVCLAFLPGLGALLAVILAIRSSSRRRRGCWKGRSSNCIVLPAPAAIRVL